jgi:hypothetical protein
MIAFVTTLGLLFGSTTLAAANQAAALTVRIVGLPPGQHSDATLTGPGGLRRAIRSSLWTLAHPRPGLYRLALRPVHVRRTTGTVRRGALARPVDFAMKVYVRDGRDAKITGAYGTILNPGVQSARAIRSVVGDPTDPVAIRLAAGSKRPPTGTILTSGPTALLPVGLVSRVTGTTRRGQTLEVSLKPVPVSEAVPELSYTGSISLHLARGASGGSPDLAGEASATHARAASGCTPPSLVKFGAHLDSVELREAFLGSWPPQIKLTLAVRTTEELGVALAAAGINCDWSGHELGPYSAGIPVGPVVVPVYATIPLKAGVHINGTLQAGTLHIASTTVAHAAAGWDETAASLNQQGSNVWTSGVLSLTGSAKLSASIGVQAGIGIAKGANAHLEAGFGPEFDWSSGHDCELLLDLGSLSAGVTVLGRSLNTPAFTPFKAHLWSGCHPASTGGGGGGGAGGGGGGGGGSPDGAITVEPAAVVAGEAFFVTAHTVCPAGSSSFYPYQLEVLPAGAPFDEKTDSDHETFFFGGNFLISPETGGFGIEPNFIPGQYDVALRCVSSTSSPTFLFQRAPLSVKEGKQIAIEPTSVAPGETATISGAPCVPEGAGIVLVTLRGEHSTIGEDVLANADSSCKWGPANFVIPAGAEPGEYAVEVAVPRGIGTSHEQYFRYKTALLFIS